jgi:hypothetical protein
MSNIITKPAGFGPLETGEKVVFCFGFMGKKAQELAQASLTWVTAP